MSVLIVMQFIVNTVIMIVLLTIMIFGVIWLFKDKGQNQYSILRNFPALGQTRYISEKTGPELRQYFFANDNEGKPFSRSDYKNAVSVGKYKSRMTSFGTGKDYLERSCIQNTMFSLQTTELHVDHTEFIPTFLYHIENERLFSREEYRKSAQVDPLSLTDERAVASGSNLKHPPKIKHLVGQSGMSYGALGKNAITALSMGLAKIGTWMNTGEGGLSEYHLKGNGGITYQIGPGLFGVRDHDGNFDRNMSTNLAEHSSARAFEIKLAQGAKTRGRHMEGNKVTEEVACIRSVKPYETINSPNRFDFIKSPIDPLNLVNHLQSIGQEPVGFKIVVSKVEETEALVKTMIKIDTYPSFITVDSGEGGIGVTSQEFEDGVGLLLSTALPTVSSMLEKYGIRNEARIFASGELVTPDKIAIASGLGADLVNIVRSMMISVGCIMSQQCHLNTHPVGVAITDPKKERGFVVDKKQYRITNYVTSLHEGLFNIVAAVGIHSPTGITFDHTIYRQLDGTTTSTQDYKLELIS